MEDRRDAQDLAEGQGPGSNIISRNSEYVNENTSSFLTSIRYLCLPDTVNPRGPKGDGR